MWIKLADVFEVDGDFRNGVGKQAGFVTVNGFNLGRYWEIGPTKTLYVPAPILKEGRNEIIVFESDGATSKTVEFFDHPDLG